MRCWKRLPQSVHRQDCAHEYWRVAPAGAAADSRTLRDADSWRVLALGLEYKLLAYDEHADNKSFAITPFQFSGWGPAHITGVDRFLI